MIRRTSTTSPGMQRIIAALQKGGPMSDEKLCELACVGINTFRCDYRRTLIEEKLIHVCEYRRNVQGPYVPIYAAGERVGPAPRKPTPLTQAQRCRNWRVSSGYDEARKAGRRLAKPELADPVLAALLPSNTQIKEAA